MAELMKNSQLSQYNGNGRIPDPRALGGRPSVCVNAALCPP